MHGFDCYFEFDRDLAQTFIGVVFGVFLGDSLRLAYAHACQLVSESNKRFFVFTFLCLDVDSKFLVFKNYRVFALFGFGFFAQNINDDIIIFFDGAFYGDGGAIHLLKFF